LPRAVRVANPCHPLHRLPSCRWVHGSINFSTSAKTIRSPPLVHSAGATKYTLPHRRVRSDKRPSLAHLVDLWRVRGIAQNLTHLGGWVVLNPPRHKPQKPVPPYFCTVLAHHQPDQITPPLFAVGLPTLRSRKNGRFSAITVRAALLVKASALACIEKPCARSPCRPSGNRTRQPAYGLGATPICG